MSNGSNETVSSTGMPEWVQPYAQHYLQSSQNVANQPYQPYSGQTVAGMNDYQRAGLDAQAQRAMQGSPVTNAASGELQKTLSGGYLNNNPYMSSMIDSASQDVLRNMTNVDARSGSFGNSGVTQDTARGMADIATQMRGQDYANERSRMMAGVGMAPTIAGQDYADSTALQQAGNAYQQQDQANLSDQYNRFNEARQYPTQQLEPMGKALATNYGSTLTQPGVSPWSTGLGTAAGLYGLSGGK